MQDRFKAGVISILLPASLLGAPAAKAQDTGALRNRATAVYNKAVDDYEAGDYALACEGFDNAATLYQDASTSLHGHSLATEADRNYVKSLSDSLQSEVNDAKRQVTSACARRNDPAPLRPVTSSPPPASSNPSYSSKSTGTYTNYYPPEFDIHGSVDNLQIKLDKGHGLMVQASTQYQAKDFSGACASSRVAANAYAEARIDARAIVDGRYVQPDTIDLAKIDANAAQSAADAAEFYCKG